MKINKKYVLATAMVLVIGTGVFLNYKFNSSVPTFSDDDTVYEADKVLGEAELVSKNGQDSTYFATAKLTRQTSRDESVELLQTITTNTNNSQEVRNKAAEDINTIAMAIQKEGNIENMLLAKGFENALAVISDNGVAIMVKATDLSAAQLAQITEIVMKETNVKASAISVQKISD